MFDKELITLAHGAGGTAMRRLIEDVFVAGFATPGLSALEDQAEFGLAALMEHGDRLAFTTDTFVVAPLFFSGGDIGSLAVAGTVNDLAMSGARPLYLSCGFVLEEGLPIDTLRRVVRSMQQMADSAGVQIVTGDTKVVEKGAADQLFINTAGVGVIPRGVQVSASRAQVGDKVIVSGDIGRHGIAILMAREQLALQSNVSSDCQPLGALVSQILLAGSDVHCLRDATRGGVATVLKEFAESSNVAIQLVESALPVDASVRGACEILGLDPLYLANEGTLVAVVPSKDADKVVKAMQSAPAGRHAAVIGEVTSSPAGRVVLETQMGGKRIVEMLAGDQLPRIC
ncbi:MAG: hydrogenase expression/formation protein HypE [Pseudomonadota bacterium]|jgi:hydrogenase expression/formation protein HypE